MYYNIKLFFSMSSVTTFTEDLFFATNPNNTDKFATTKFLQKYNVFTYRKSLF